MEAGVVAFLVMGALGIGVGVLIGCVGIGGVLLVPSLAYILGMSVHEAIAAAMFAYIFSGAVGTFIYARHGSIRWNAAGWIILGAAPAAFAGAILVTVMPSLWLELLIATFIVLAGANALRGKSANDTDADPRLPVPGLVGLGAVTGIASAMTGTGGPLVLIPLTVWIGFPALTAVGLSQAVQLPIASLATAGNLSYGRLDLPTGLVLAAGLVVGAALGARLAHRVPRDRMKRVLASVLVLVGIFIISRLVLTNIFA